VDYQPISDLAQPQTLEGLLRIVLHGVLVTMAVASVLCLCLSELRLPRRRSSEVEGLGGRRSAAPLLAARRGGPVHSLAATRLWDMDADLPGGCLSEEATPALRPGQSERGHGWGEPVETR
jgi:hypothetical protein